jgi:hypothetical protein
VDFLRHFGLLVDPAANQLVDRQTLHIFKSSSTPSEAPVSASIFRPPARLLEEPSLSSTRSALLAGFRPPARLLDEPFLSSTSPASTPGSSPASMPGCSPASSSGSSPGASAALHVKEPPWVLRGRLAGCHLRPSLGGRTRGNG